jgi:hypothetical protein
MLELGANDAFGLKAEPIAVELERQPASRQFPVQ